MTSLSKNARVAGLLYILASMVGVVRLLYIPTILIVHGNATATANNIVAHESRFLPRFLGVWLMAGCFGYLALSFTGLLFPQYEDKVFTYAQPLMMGEVATMFWLVIMGAKEQRLAGGPHLAGV